MTRDVHKQTQELIALGVGGLETSQHEWLQAHLRECEPCRDYSESADRVVRSLRSLPLAADSGLVRSTQIRVRAHALQLRQKQDRMWLVWMSCLLVGLSAAITTPFFWRAFAWLGGLAGVSTSVWQAGFAFFWIAPALVVSVLFLARGTHLTDNKDQLHGWR